MDNFSNSISGNFLNSISGANTVPLKLPIIEKEIERKGFWFEGMPVTFSTFLESLARRHNVSIFYQNYGHSGLFFKTFHGKFSVKGKQSNVNAFARDYNEITTY